MRCAVLLVVAMGLACSSARRGETVERPLVVSDRQVARGQAVFMQKCHKCHPGGEAGLGPALNNKPFPSFLKRFQIRHGLGAMPSFSEDAISDDELDDLIEYLTVLRDHGDD